MNSARFNVGITVYYSESGYHLYPESDMEIKDLLTKEMEFVIGDGQLLNVDFLAIFLICFMEHLVHIVEHIEQFSVRNYSICGKM
ncbi:hypothetical protein Ciccas_014019 [Cichlidogyrus casuarinus]|uniref:Uncharacterized protein n=1 Tax=Cichlidogyrus casuarinus TaxID=1844966 RepID=A0ABD2PJU5_9PLAT